MKIQCNCGAKFSFDVTPEMAMNPVRFVCPSCGLDSSAVVRDLILKEFPPPAAAAPQPAPAASSAPPPSGSTESPNAPLCAKHRTPTVETCRLCGKPICPQCMEAFGYVCSPLCRARAASTGIGIPEFAGQKSVRQARHRRRVTASLGTVLAALVLFAGVWFWYAWFGCVPKPVFSVRFPLRAYSGQSFFAGTNVDQIVFLHGHTLARYDLKSGRQIWSRALINSNEIAALVDREIKAMALPADLPSFGPGLSPDKMREMTERSMAAALRLHVSGEHIWVQSPGKLVRYGWASGIPGKEIPLRADEEVSLEGNHLLCVRVASDLPVIARINMASGETSFQDISGNFSQNRGEFGKALAGASAASASAGLPLGNPERLTARPMDPRVAEQAQQLPAHAKLALPAMLAANMNQARLLAELDSELGTKTTAAPGKPGTAAQAAPRAVLLRTPSGYLYCTLKLLEPRWVERVAMKAAPAKSVLDGEITAAKSMDAANEILNEMQRSRGGDKVLEDLSRYQVTLHTPGSTETWSGEVIGPPEVYPLQTVNVLCSSKAITVLDHKQQKKWEAALSYSVNGAFTDLQGTTYGQGPVVERGECLFVCDSGMLSAFDLQSGKVRWRLPSVGIVSLFFDDEGMIYVNTTTAGHESLKYSRQIDITELPQTEILKVDSKDGKVIWRKRSFGIITRVAGKDIFTVQSHEPIDEEIEGTSFETGFEKQPFIRIRRLNRKTGEEVWEHFEQRAPLHVGFEKNLIRLVFRKEVEVLKFPAL